MKFLNHQKWLLLISDFFWGIVSSGRIILPSGLFLLSSKLGYLLMGKFSDPNSDTKSDNHQLVAYFVMIHMNQCVSEINLFSATDTTTNKMPDLL